LYDTFDGFSSGIPMFSAHLAMSTDHGLTFSDNTLETFLSSATDNGDQRQRVFGDYQQVKAVGTTFYGVFTGNGVPFGRPFANHDPIFFKIAAPSPGTLVATVTCDNSYDLYFNGSYRGSGADWTHAQTYNLSMQA